MIKENRANIMYRGKGFHLLHSNLMNNQFTDPSPFCTFHPYITVTTYVYIVYKQY